MNYDIIIAFGLAIGLMFAIFAAIKIVQFRRAFLVPEGYAGLLYHKGKFVQVLGAGRHIRWGGTSRSMHRTSAGLLCSWPARTC